MEEVQESAMEDIPLNDLNEDPTEIRIAGPESDQYYVPVQEWHARLVHNQEDWDYGALIEWMQQDGGLNERTLYSVYNHYWLNHEDPLPGPYSGLLHMGMENTVQHYLRRELLGTGPMVAEHHSYLEVMDNLDNEDAALRDAGQPIPIARRFPVELNGQTIFFLGGQIDHTQLSYDPTRNDPLGITEFLLNENLDENVKQTNSLTRRMEESIRHIYLQTKRTRTAVRAWATIIGICEETRKYARRTWSDYLWGQGLPRTNWTETREVLLSEEVRNLANKIDEMDNEIQSVFMLMPQNHWNEELNRHARQYFDEERFAAFLNMARRQEFEAHRPPIRKRPRFPGGKPPRIEPPAKGEKEPLREVASDEEVLRGSKEHQNIPNQPEDEFVEASPVPFSKREVLLRNKKAAKDEAVKAKTQRKRDNRMDETFVIEQMKGLDLNQEAEENQRKAPRFVYVHQVKTPSHTTGGKDSGQGNPETDIKYQTPAKMEVSFSGYDQKQYQPQSMQGNIWSTGNQMASGFGESWTTPMRNAPKDWMQPSPLNLAGPQPRSSFQNSYTGPSAGGQSAVPQRRVTPSAGAMTGSGTMGGTPPWMSHAQPTAILPWAQPTMSLQMMRQRQLDRLQQHWMDSRRQENVPLLRNQHEIDAYQTNVALTAKANPSKLKAIREWIGQYELSNVHSINQFAGRVQQMMTNTDIHPSDIDAVLTDCMRQHEQARIWFRSWKGIHPETREPFDAAFAQQFLPYVSAAEIQRKCQQFRPDLSQDIITNGHRLREEIRPYVELIKNPVEYAQAEEELLYTFRSMIGQTHCLHLSMTGAINIDQAIAVIENYRMMEPRDGLKVPSDYKHPLDMPSKEVSKRVASANSVVTSAVPQTMSMEEDPEQPMASSQAPPMVQMTPQLATRATVMVTPAPAPGTNTTYFCEHCNAYGHSRPRCVTYAKSIGRDVPEAYPCKKCGVRGDHWDDNCSQGNMRNMPTERKGWTGSYEPVKCYNCQRTGHYAKECPSPRQQRTSVNGAAGRPRTGTRPPISITGHGMTNTQNQGN